MKCSIFPNWHPPSTKTHSITFRSDCLTRFESMPIITRILFTLFPLQSLGVEGAGSLLIQGICSIKGARCWYCDGNNFVGRYCVAWFYPGLTIAP